MITFRLDMRPISRTTSCFDRPGTGDGRGVYIPEPVVQSTLSYASQEMEYRSRTGASSAIGIPPQPSQSYEILSCYHRELYARRLATCSPIQMADRIARLRRPCRLG